MVCVAGCTLQHCQQGLIASIAAGTACARCTNVRSAGVALLPFITIAQFCLCQCSQKSQSYRRVCCLLVSFRTLAGILVAAVQGRLREVAGQVD